MSPSPEAPHATRLILYVGKGGVGKTTLAAATAVRAAAHGHRTLVVSTDIAHSLGDILQQSFTGEPIQVADRLFAQEIDVLEETRRTWGEVQHHIADELRDEGISAVQADELAVMPGMQEIAALVQIGRKAREGAFDCIVVDAAPTGETIRLLTMPESFAWYARKIQAWRGKLNRVTRTLLRLPDLGALDVLDQLHAGIDELRALLTDVDRTTYRIVVTPDRAVLKEAQRAETYLSLFQYPIDAVIVNRVLPDDPAGGQYMQKLIAHQRELMTEINDAFAPLPIFEGRLTTEEPLGVAQLDAFGRDVFGDADPTDVKYRGRTISFDQEGDDVVLRIPMPNVEIEKLVLTKRWDALYVDVGNFRREIQLPVALADSEPQGAKMREGSLEIRFTMGATSGQGDGGSGATVSGPPAR